MLRLLCIALLSALVSSNTPYDSCGGATKVVSFQLNDCMGSPCTVHKGQPVSGSVVIIPDRNSAAPTVKVSAEILGMDVELKTLDCSSLTPTPCPLVAGVQKTIVYSFDIPSELPNVQVPVKISLLDDQGQLMFCGKLVVKVV